MKTFFYRLPARRKNSFSNLKALSVLCGAALTAVGVAQTPAQARPPSSAEVARQLRQLDAEDDALADVMQIESVGKSVQQRDILLVRLAAAPNLPSVYVICRQHGDEAAPTEAALQLIREMVQNPERQELLRRVALHIVPIANPDGADGYKRANARGVNLNRDWARQTQPETRAIARSIARSNTHVVIDAHENYPWEPWGAYLEPGRVSSTVRRDLLGRVTSAIVQEAEPDHGLRRTNGGGPATLAHRHFSVRGIPSLLLESQQTSEGGDFERRSALHRDAISTTLRVVADAMPGLVYPQPSLVPPAEEAAPRFEPSLLDAPSLDRYEFALGAAQMVVDTEATDEEQRIYRVQGLTRLVLIRAKSGGRIRSAELRFASNAAKTWQDALNRAGIATSNVTAELNPDNSITLRGVRTTRGAADAQVRWLPPTEGDGRLEFIFSDVATQ